MATTEKLALIDNSGVSTTDLLINTGTPTFEGKAEPQTSVELFDNDGSGAPPHWAPQQLMPMAIGASPSQPARN